MSSHSDFEIDFVAIPPGDLSLQPASTSRRRSPSLSSPPSPKLSPACQNKAPRRKRPQREIEAMSGPAERIAKLSVDDSPEPRGRLLFPLLSLL
jgi:hypothetical protein